MHAHMYLDKPHAKIHIQLLGVFLKQVLLPTLFVLVITYQSTENAFVSIQPAVGILL
jgi:hypothetical protein